MNLKSLSDKYPEYKVVKNPLSRCPLCSGSGEYSSKSGHVSLCICVTLNSIDIVRRLRVLEFRKTVLWLSDRLDKYDVNIKTAK